MLGQADRQTVTGQAGRETDRQTDKKTDRQTDIRTDKQTKIILYSHDVRRLYYY
jgi:hypothetical protein